MPWPRGLSFFGHFQLQVSRFTSTSLSLFYIYFRRTFLIVIISCLALFLRLFLISSSPFLVFSFSFLFFFVCFLFPRNCYLSHFLLLTERSPYFITYYHLKSICFIINLFFFTSEQIGFVKRACFRTHTLSYFRCLSSLASQSTPSKGVFTYPPSKRLS